MNFLNWYERLPHPPNMEEVKERNRIAHVEQSMKHKQKCKCFICNNTFRQAEMYSEVIDLHCDAKRILVCPLCIEGFKEDKHFFNPFSYKVTCMNCKGETRFAVNGEPNFPLCSHECLAQWGFDVGDE